MNLSVSLSLAEAQDLKSIIQDTAKKLSELNMNKARSIFLEKSVSYQKLCDEIKRIKESGGK